MMENEALTKEVAVAAKWWADQLRRDVKPSRQTMRPGQADILGSMLSAYGADVPDVDESRIVAFENALLPLLRKRFEDDPYRGLGCDYHPDDLFYEAAEIANIDDLDRYLPIKTMMWVEFGSVRVKVGYGSPIKTLYPSAPSDTDRADAANADETRE